MLWCLPCVWLEATVRGLTAVPAGAGVVQCHGHGGSQPGGAGGRATLLPPPLHPVWDCACACPAGWGNVHLPTVLQLTLHQTQGPRKGRTALPVLTQPVLPAAPKQCLH